MQKLEIVLVADDNQQPVIKATDLNLNINFNDGNIYISGKEALTLSNGQQKVAQLPPLGVRVAEIEGMMPPQAENFAARKAIGEAFLAAITPAFETAVKAIYDLDNPAAL